MKKKVLFAAMLSATLLGATQAVKAHPGRTDGNGCHTCRTNCEKWGLAYGEYPVSYTHLTLPPIA